MPKRRNWKRLVAVLGLLILAFVAFTIWILHELRTPHSRQNTEATVIIPRGSGTGTIVDKLCEANIVSSRFPILMWIKLGSGKRLKAGEYRFQSPITPLQV